MKPYDVLESARSKDEAQNGKQKRLTPQVRDTQRPTKAQGQVPTLGTELVEISED